MNKEQLIKLKRELEEGNKKKYYTILMKNGEISDDEDVLDYTLSDLITKRKTQEAVLTLTNNFEILINLLNKYNNDYDELSFLPNFYLLVSEEDYDIEEGELKPNSKFIEDNVLVQFKNFNMKKNGVEMPKIKISEQLELLLEEKFYISFNQFRTLLAMEGFELEGINNFEDLKYNSTGKITIEFLKEYERNLN